MAIVSTSRASYQHHNFSNRPNLNKPRKVASESEIGRINKAIVALNNAKTCTTNETDYLANVTEAFKLARDLARERIL